MKRTDITYQEKLNELRLDISHPNSNGICFVLLEGETDIRLFRKLFNLDNCKVENIPGGNKKLEECVQALVGIFPLVFGIRDADFIRLNDSSYSVTNMFLTDCHDIELTILNCGAILNAIIFEYSGMKIGDHEIFKTNAMEVIKYVSYLKLVNDREGLELSFSPGFQDLISFSNLSFDLDQYLIRVISKSPNAIVKDKTLLKAKILAEEQCYPDLLQISNGHDLMNVFALYFREVEGRSGVSGELLEAVLRMLFTVDFFCQTQLFHQIDAWQNINNVEITK